MHIGDCNMMLTLTCDQTKNMAPAHFYCNVLIALFTQNISSACHTNDKFIPTLHTDLHNVHSVSRLHHQGTHCYTEYINLMLSVA